MRFSGTTNDRPRQEAKHDGRLNLNAHATVEHPVFALEFQVCLIVVLAEVKSDRRHVNADQLETRSPEVLLCSCLWGMVWPLSAALSAELTKPTRCFGHPRAVAVGRNPLGGRVREILKTVVQSLSGD